MAADRRVRIIKREERGCAEQTAKRAQADAKPVRREVAAAVSSWVREFRQQHEENARRNFQSLFKETATQSLGYSRL